MKLAIARQVCVNITDNFKFLKLDGSTVQTNKNGTSQLRE
jgi:hypothetical protein